MCRVWNGGGRGQGWGLLGGREGMSQQDKEGDAEHKDAAPPIRDTGSIQCAVNQAANISTARYPQGKSRAPCKYFLSKRGCTYGSDCKFLHVVDSTPLETKDEVVKDHSDLRGERERRGRGGREAAGAPSPSR